MTLVTKDEFYGEIYRRNLNVHPTIINGKWPYTSVFRYLNSPHASPFGKAVELANGTKEYYLNEDFAS